MIHFTGNPCKKCSRTLRYVRGRACVACGRAHAKEQRSGENYAGFRAYQRAYVAAKGSRPRTDTVREQENARYHRRAALKAEQRGIIAAVLAPVVAARTADAAIQKAEHKRAYMRGWRRENPLIASAQSRAKKARRKNAPGRHTAADVQAIGGRQKWRCAWCGKPCDGNYHVDHIIPLARGGSNGPENICIACPPCNLSKKAKLPHEFAQSMGKLL